MGSELGGTALTLGVERRLYLRCGQKIPNRKIDRISHVWIFSREMSGDVLEDTHW